MIRSWRDFSATIASADLRDTAEEGAYDEAYKIGAEQRLAYLQRLRDHQPLPDRFINEGEVWRAIRKLQAGKAPGEDGILTDIIKSAADAIGKSKLKPGNTVITALTLLFNFVLEREVWPDRWGSGIIFPLHKGDSRLDPSNYRPITLMSVVGKLFGSIIIARLQDFSKRTGSIADEQGGFRPKRGTPDQILLLREILESRREREDHLRTQPTSTPARLTTPYGVRTRMSASTTRGCVASYGDSYKQCTRGSPGAYSCPWALRTCF
jgi:hypothetical protein